MRETECDGGTGEVRLDARTSYKWRSTPIWLDRTFKQNPQGDVSNQPRISSMLVGYRRRKALITLWKPWSLPLQG
jgi:hypothetical protein